MATRNMRDKLDMPTDKAVRVGRKWKYTCGLEMVHQSIVNIPNDHYITRDVSIMRLAHERHHNGLDTDYVKPSLGESHDPTATLYFQSRKNTQGKITLVAAWCSCGFDPFA